MASTITIQSTMNWATAYLNFSVPAVGASNEPSITNANTVLQAMTGPPFRWNWNRNTASFVCIPGTQDYTTGVPTFGFIESASLTNGSATFAIKEIKQELTAGNEAGRPQSIAAQIDNNSGAITFRLLPVPDFAYTVTVTFQQKTSLITALANTWSPIPDQYSYIYNWGFLALSMAYDDDARFPVFNQKFIAHLLGAQQGLSETERNMFLDSWNLIARQEFLNQMKSQQGRAALGT